MNQLTTVEQQYNHLLPAIENQGIKALLPEHITVEQFARVAATAIHSNQNLQVASSA